MWAYIDLTDETHRPPTPTLQFPVAPVQLLPIPHDEPPVKRRRVDNALTRRRGLKECLQEQVLPHVSQVVRSLPEGVYYVNNLAVQAVTALARTARFRTRLDETNGYLTPQDEAVIAVRARHEIARLTKLPEYRIPIESPLIESLIRTTNPLGPGSEVAPKQIHKPPRPSQPTTNEEPHDLGNFDRLPYRLRTKRTEPKSNNPYFHLDNRPYQTAASRDAIAKGALHPLQPRYRVPSQPTVYHVDFTSDEIAKIAECVSEYESEAVPATVEALAERCHIYDIPKTVQGKLKGRMSEDIRNFCSDLLAGQATPLSDGCMLSMSRDVNNQRAEAARASRVTSLLLAREMEGNIGFGRTRQLVNFQNELTKAREDDLQVVAEFTNCAGDITTGSWVSSDNLICGTTAHSDTHNQQYNKPGNLLLCSTTEGTLRSFPDHRIPRPRVEKGENSTEAMRRSQDPWLYSSVVSSDYDEDFDLAFTSSFDKTVKVWKVDPTGRSIEALATWQHTSIVNFVIAAKDGSGRVATAADSPSEAVRVYTVNPDNVAESSVQSLSCTRTDADGSDKWAYFPATLQWGRAPGTQHLLLIGYSPRSTSGEDLDIPEDKRNSGEITLWDAAEGRRLPVMTASTANVFEVAWHPKVACFIVATTLCTFTIDHNVRTQIHIFRRDRERQDGAYSQFQALDCFASDINELTFRPNSVRHAYITAACTDGNVYVWDTAQGDKPIHILKHGYPLDEFYEDREREDTGVKFTAWGSSADRFYTGSSDGKVKVWNVRNRRKPLVRDLLEAPGPISFGTFSPDRRKLAVGDATGRIFIFSVDERDVPESHFIALPGSSQRVRRSKPLIPHPEPPPPDADRDAVVEDDDTMDADEDDSESDIAVYSRNTYLESQQLTLNRNPVIGAVQGPKYAATGLFRREAHLNSDPALPLLADFERNQLVSTAASRGGRRRSVRRLRAPGSPNERLLNAHYENEKQDLAVMDMPVWSLAQLREAGAVLNPEEDWGYEYEETPRSPSPPRRYE
ncbi:hypothetical protein BGZ61DRAFT_448524 [Ilyonectria robusta]|uniref:uncharacterized protein n=1 Tax=Ilyonectria robusta TaxID=1079257 RepID=UPI001E8DC849|nr:uncharacterized protein BGZ61DRAFT_448524 [Ilyonectria robusta]KAH8714158.1 hypothetical protein BGZ61DRAFT_448524 [Ilyonectria robusta]